MSREPLNPDLAGVEAALSTLRPSPASLDRDRLMFLAGQAAGLRRARLAAWVATGVSAAAMLAVCVLGVLLVQRPGTGAARQTADVPAAQPGQTEASSWAVIQPGPSVSAESLGLDARYLKLRQLVLTRGVEAMPDLAPAAAKDQSPAPPSSQRRMLEQMLDG